MKKRRWETEKNELHDEKFAGDDYWNKFYIYFYMSVTHLVKMSFRRSFLI